MIAVAAGGLQVKRKLHVKPVVRQDPQRAPFGIDRLQNAGHLIQIRRNNRAAGGATGAVTAGSGVGAGADGAAGAL